VSARCAASTTGSRRPGTPAGTPAARTAASRASRRARRSRSRRSSRRRTRRRTPAGIRRALLPACAASWGCSGLFLFLRRRRRDRLDLELVALGRRKLLVLGPLRADVLALLGRHLGDLAGGLARLAALLRG